MFGREAWPGALREWARAYRAALAAHPNIVPFLARGPGRRPAALGLADAVYGCLVDAGWPPSYATRIGALMRYLVWSTGPFARASSTIPSFTRNAIPISAARTDCGAPAAGRRGAFELAETPSMPGAPVQGAEPASAETLISPTKARSIDSPVTKPMLIVRIARGGAGMKVFESVDALRAAVGEHSGYSDGTRSRRNRSTSSPRQPATTTGSTPTPSGPHKARSAPRSRTVT